MGTELNNSGVHAWLILWKAYEACRAHAEYSIENLGMCYSDFAVLECLMHKGSLPVNVIGHKVSLNSSSSTAAVDRLETRGLVERKFSQTDRRARIVYLTASGKKMIAKSFRNHEDDMEAFFAVLTAAERRTLIELLKKLGKQEIRHD
jgi:MarR family 2-MHQ and catechol resistance regulon transcriptional repressor